MEDFAVAGLGMMLLPVILLLVMHIACAGFCSGLAKAKHRRNVDWFFLGLLFGIIALIAAAGMPENRNKIDI